MGLFNRTQTTPTNQTEEDAGITLPPAVPALVDTSVIIDGRIVDIAKAGFAPGKLLVPRFVLAELQLISDSGDAMKRGRGRRGLEMLHTMREGGVDIEIIEYDYDDIKEVDAKLVRLGRHLGANVLTTDYNLNRVASIEGVRVLNINELANAVRPVILPGEHMTTKIVQPGKEKGQGVGYLADGTMIVVDSGDKLMGQEVEVEITRVFQTVAGKMLFAIMANAKGGQPRANANPPRNQSQPNLPRPHNHDQGPVQAPAKPQTRGTQSKPQSRVQASAPATAEGVPVVTSDKVAGQAERTDRRKQNNPRNDNRGDGAKPNARRPKRMSPTQRLENSLMELTGGDSDKPAA